MIHTMIGETLAKTRALSLKEYAVPYKCPSGRFPGCSVPICHYTENNGLGWGWPCGLAISNGHQSRYGASLMYVNFCIKINAIPLTTKCNGTALYQLFSSSNSGNDMIMGLQVLTHHVVVSYKDSFCLECIMPYAALS